MYNCPLRWFTVADEMSVDEMSVDDRSVVDEMSVDELSWNRLKQIRIQLWHQCSCMATLRMKSYFDA